jgi:hypothetical protein
VPLPNRNRRDPLDPAHRHETPRARAAPVVTLADWVAELQQSVRRTRHRRRIAVATGSAAVLMLTTVGVALATDRAGDDGAQISTPLTDPGAGGSVTAPPVHGNPIERVTPPPRPGGLTLWARGVSDVVAAGQQLGVEISWRDGNGRLVGLGQDWGDGTRGSTQRPGGCAHGATAARGSTMVWHAWWNPGTYTVRLSATTATCDGRTEARYVTFTVRVVAAGQRVDPAPGPVQRRPGATPTSPGPPLPPPSPSPTATPSPTPSPSGSPSPSPSPSPPTPTAPVPTTTGPSPTTPTPPEVSSSAVSPPASPSEQGR